MVNPASKINANKAARKGNSRSIVKSSTRSGRRSTELFQRNLSTAQLGKSTRLHITEQPAKKFFTCTAKTNRLRIGVEVPEGVTAPASMPVDLVLIYAKTQRVVEDQSIMCTFQKIHSLEGGKGTFEFRIEEVSSRHNRQNFAIKVQPRDTRFKAAYTSGIVVKAKKPKPKRVNGRWEEPQDEMTGGVMLPSLACGHMARYPNSCARFLEDTLMEIREMINTKLEDVIVQIRNCDTLATQHDPHSDADVDMFSPNTSPTRMPGMSLPPAGCPPMPPAMIPPPLLPPMVNGVPGMPNHQIHINIGGPNTHIVPPKSFQFPLQNLDLNDTEAFPMGPHETPCLHSSDSSTTSTPTSRGSLHGSSKSRERSLTPDEEVEAYFRLTEACRSTVTPSMILPPAVQPTA